MPSDLRNDPPWAVAAMTEAIDETAEERAANAAAAAGLDVDEGDAAGLMVQSASGVIEAATPQAEIILGLTLDQMLGRDSSDRRWAAIDESGVPLRPQDHPAMRAIRAGVAVRGAVMGVHRPGRDVAGEHVWLIVDSVPMNIGGTTPTVVSRFAVMTGPRVTELRLAASERLHRFLVENTPDMVAWQLPDTTFMWVSGVSRTMFGREPEEMVGTTVYDYVHPDDLTTLRTAHSAIRDGLAPTVVLLRMRHRDGHYLWMEIAGQVIRDTDGTASQFHTAWRDVTARVAAERERDAALRLVQSAIESSPIGIALCRPDGTFEQVNSALCAMLGFRRDVLIGRPLGELVEPGARAPDHFATLLAGAPAVHDSEFRFLRGDGTWMWGHCTLVAIRDEDRPGTSRMLLQLQDVTERRRALDELAQLASHDSLTGLGNRTALSDHLVRTARDLAPDELSAMLFIDVDDFKVVNDTHGHDIGDKLLGQIGKRVRDTIRSDDFAARLGGDEFVVFCPRVIDVEHVSRIVGRVSGELSGTYLLGGHAIGVSVSVGVTTTRGPAVDELMARSDQAMYRAKRAGRGLVAIDDLLEWDHH